MSPARAERFAGTRRRISAGDLPRSDSRSPGRARADPVTDSIPGARRFVVATLASCLALLVAVLTFNVLIDPFAIVGTGIVPTAVENDREVKLTLIEELRSSPEILVLGSSRARQAEPELLRKLTGRNAFNAGVTGGTAADALVFTRFIADRYPGEKRSYLWFVDVGIAGAGVNPQLARDARASRYLEQRRRFGLEDVGTYLSPGATRASLRVFGRCVLRSCDARITFGPDGSIPRTQLRFLPEQEWNVKRAAAALVAAVRADPPARKPRSPSRNSFFERTLAFMNSRGERPVIVLNPVYPTVLAELRRHGFPELEESMSYLRGLRRRGFDFVLLNCQDIRTWGGLPEDFANPTHVNLRNMRRMLEYVVARTGRELS
jgi:hypothetical protein